MLRRHGRLRLQQIDTETSDLVALMRGPLLLYGVGSASRVKAADLLTATQSTEDSWVDPILRSLLICKVRKG